MRISQRILSQYTVIPEDPHELRLLLDDIGIEVKKCETLDVNNYQDTFFDLEILANRGDHCSYLGIAREIHGRAGSGIKMPAVASLLIGPSPHSLQISTDLCLRYSLTLLELFENPPDLPDYVFAPLAAANLHRISPVVDVSNLVNIEIGQPTHMFDADKIEGPIVVRLSVDGEHAWPLFSENPISLPVGTIVIADSVKILAIAGVIGCEDSKATKNTRRILLESGTFDPVSIRKTSQALGIRTDSSYRFERGGDPALVKVGAARVIKLMRDYCCAAVLGRTSVTGAWEDPLREIDFSISAANQFLGLKMSADDMCERLERYGFTASQKDGNSRISVRVPPGRLWDVEYPSDLYEELAKSFGYNNVPTLLPAIDLGGVKSSAEKVRENTEEILIGYGFYEVFTDGFYSADAIDVFDLPIKHPLHQHVRVLGAVDKGHALLKNNGLLQLLEAVADNVRRKETMIKAFEWTRTFHPDESSENGLCKERRILACITSGPLSPASWNGSPGSANSLFLKGVLFELGYTLGIPFYLGSEALDHPLTKVMHPGRHRTITLENRVVGIMGEIHPEVCRRVGIKRQEVRPCYLELEVSALESKSIIHKYKEPEVRMPSARSLAFTMPFGIEAEEVLHIIKQTPNERILSVDVVDEYLHEENNNLQRTLTFEVLWSNDEHILTAEELNEATDKLRQSVEDVLGPRGVHLR